ncbi:MAG: hypothetical protein K6G68_06230 [Oscillospiraceae bacterium]|nr:hypothetical protein [Oscillospiraceae bacterium]
MDYNERDCDVLIPLENLGLSNRSFNCLRRSGILNFHDFMQINSSQLELIHNLGEKSIAEITALQKKYAEEPPEIPLSEEQLSLFSDDGVFEYKGLYYKNLPVEKLGMTVRPVNCLKNRGINFLSELIMLNDREIKSLQNLGRKSAMEIKKAISTFTDPMVAVNYSSGEELEHADQREKVLEIHDLVMELLRRSIYDGLTYDSIEAFLKVDYSVENIRKVLERMVAAKQITVEKNTYYIPLRSYRDALDDFSNEKQANIFRKRINGATLEEIAQETGLTRERVRQIEKRVLTFLERTGPVKEDSYSYLFMNYDVDHKQFMNLTGEPIDVYSYMILKHRYKGETPISEAQEDDNISPELRSKIRKMYGDYISVDGRKVKLTRTAIEKFIIETYCTTDTNFEDFFEMYRRFISKHGLSSYKELVATNNMKRTFENYVSTSNMVLWKQNRRFRYYDIESEDFTELLDTLNLEQYHDVHYSSLKFFNLYPELMERYDIRDEYELHNLLRKLYIKKNNDYIYFNKMPMIEFGSFDRDEAVKTLMFSLAPISIDDLAKVMYDEYGIRPSTVKSNWFSAITDYYIDGMYVTTSAPLPDDHMRMLKDALKDDFYFINEVKDIYSQLAEDADTSLITAFNLKSLGFTVNSTYIVSDKYESARSYFGHLLSDHERTDMTQLAKRFTGIVSFSDNLARLKDNYTIIEYEPYKLINYRGYVKLGINHKKIKQFCDEAAAFVEADKYFTIERLRAQGFTSCLDDVKFGHWFYSSLLREDSRFSYQKMGKTVLFMKTSRKINREHFILNIIKDEKSIPLNAIRRKIMDEYAIEVSRWDVVMAVENNGYIFDRENDLIVRTGS